MPDNLPSPETLERERQCLELRRAGVTFDVIAERVGYANRGSAYHAYKRAIERTRPLSSPEAYELELDRLERLHAAVWPQALRGDLAAVDRVLRITAVRAVLMNGARGTPTSEQSGDVIDDLAARRSARRESAG